MTGLEGNVLFTVIWLRTILIVRKETRCRHIDYSFRLTARVLLYAPSHRQDSTYHGLCYTSRGALAGTRNSSTSRNQIVVVVVVIVVVVVVIIRIVVVVLLVVIVEVVSRSNTSSSNLYYLTTHSPHFNKCYIGVRNI